MRWLLMLLSIAIPLPVNGVDLSRLNVVDLSHAYNEQTLYWPTSPSGFELEILSSGETEGGWYYSANAFCTPEHGGTHLDAPVHFSRGGLSVEAIPLERLMGPAAVIDVSEKVDADQDYRLTTADVLRWEAANGRVPAGRRRGTAHRMEQVLARCEALSRGRHVGRRLQPALSIVWGGGSAVSHRSAGHRGAGGRHGEH